MMSPTTVPRLSENRDADVAEYRSLNAAAVGGLVLGLLSPAALVDPVAWCIPAAGILASVYALLRIRRNAAELTGRKAALWGLWLSLCFAAAAPADLLYYRYRICQEANQFTMLWFDLLAEGRPERAFQLTTVPKDRRPLDDRLWDYYNNNPVQRATLDRYIAPAKEGEKPAAVRTLLALGKSAKATYLALPPSSRTRASISSFCDTPSPSTARAGKRPSSSSSNSFDSLPKTAAPSGESTGRPARRARR